MPLKTSSVHLTQLKKESVNDLEGRSKEISQTETQRKRNEKIFFNRPSKSYRTEQYLHKAMENLSNATKQVDLIDIYRTLHLTTVEFTCFSHAHDTFTKMDHVWGHKTMLTNLKE